MARGAWDQNATLCAVLANCHRGKGQRAFAMQDFHPFRRGEGGGSAGIRLTPATIGVLKACLSEKKLAELEKRRRQRQKEQAENG